MRKIVQLSIQLYCVAILLLSILAIAGCTAEAKQPQHALEIGEPVYARTTDPFASLADCEKFRKTLIVLLHDAHKEIPEPMRCQ